ncbi:Dyp-type peroxidase [Rhodopila sp.]|uniref:Dyp-type peroxidase n=1 Tax=Rhodopila sp. TaxID=2480087 RepID=UPI003D108B0A
MKGFGRRGVLGAAVGLAGAVRATGLANADEKPPSQPPLIKTASLPPDPTLPFHGPNQNGIVTPMQAHTSFAAFDLLADKAADVAALMRAWTDAAAQLTQGLPLAASGDPAAMPGDSGEADGLPPNRLTLTFGFGPGLFSADGVDRYGLARYRPEAFVDLPRFVGDQLVPERTGGDLSVQVCGDDKQAVFHALRAIMRVADGVARVRWVQSGFLPGSAPKTTPRNLMGFKDGTANLDLSDPDAVTRHLWVGEEGGAWMRGGSYAVVRPIRIALEHWDRMKLAFQEQTVGREKASGAAIGAKKEFAAADLDAVDGDGNPMIAENAHIRLASPKTNDGAQILRRGYGYDNGVSMVAERWPPWRHQMELDAGLLFVCYQRDPRAGFIRIFDRMARFDMMNQFVTPVGGGLFACPGGVAPGRYLGQNLFEA